MGFNVILLFCMLLLLFSYGASQWTCGCGCCHDPSCTGYVPSLGWILEGTALCNGNVTKDSQYCVNQCLDEYSICGNPFHMQGNCVDVDDNKIIVKNTKLLEKQTIDDEASLN